MGRIAAGFVFISLLAAVSGLPTRAAAETRTVTDGVEVHESAPILRAEPPTHFVTKETCAAAQPGWTIDPASVTTHVVTARMMDPSGDPDWKVEKAEGRTRLDNGNSRICLAAYCEGPFQFQCEILVRASWREIK
jgi:hypothetical protein